MRLIGFIAWHYLFAPKSHNAINIITLISMCGVILGTMALVCVLSVLNGFERVVQTSFGHFDPELKITIVKGKVFSVADSRLAAVRADRDVAVFSCVLEENALVSYNNHQLPVTLKGVEANFTQLVDFDSIMITGHFRPGDTTYNFAAAGFGLADQLGLSVDYVNPINLYVPRRTAKVNLARPDNAFKQSALYVSGIFAVTQDQYDNAYLLVPLPVVHTLLDYDSTMVSAVELKLQHTSHLEKTEKRLQTLLGDTFKVQNRNEQQKDFYRIMRIEKWITFLILTFILLIATFNIIGSLSMLLIDKSDDIATLSHLGVDRTTMRNIFVTEGWLISAVGVTIGIVIGVTICLLQQHFGFIKMSDSNAFVESYPVQVRVFDLLIVFAAILLMGFGAAWYAVSNEVGKNHL